MTWVRTVNEQEAEGKVKEIYAAFKEQVGFVPNIMRLQVGFVPNIMRLFSIKPRSLEATANMFKAFMYGPSLLSRAQREAIALATSVINQCHY